MPIPPDYVDECMYAPDVWYLHDVTEIDVEKNLVRGVMDTTRLGAIVDAQRHWPGHEKHVPAALGFQVTGTLGHLHAVYCLGLRATEGWIGFGTHVEHAKFGKMARIGPPLLLECRAVRNRNVRGAWFTTYAFRFEQEGTLNYESTQMAVWLRTEHRGPLPR